MPFILMAASGIIANQISTIPKISEALQILRDDLGQRIPVFRDAGVWESSGRQIGYVLT
jgi:hypothetical protein